MTSHDTRQQIATGRLNRVIESLRRWWWICVVEGMPAALRGAELVLSEELICTQHPVPLHGRPDQVYRLERGLGPLVIVDTKRSVTGRVTPDMVVQLSVYATILRHAPLPGCGGVEVAPWGFVRLTQRGRKPRYVRVTLWTDQDIVAAYHQHQQRRRVARDHWLPVRESIDRMIASGLTLEQAIDALDDAREIC